MAEAVLVIDDHPLFREGLLSVLQQLLPGGEVLGVDDAQAGLVMAQEHPQIKLVLVDRQLPKMNGLAAIPLFQQCLPGIPVVVISASEQATDARAAFAAGARGFVPKSSKPQTILNALRLVIDGGMYVPPMLLDAIPGKAGNLSGTSDVDEFGLTQRQRQVLAKLCAGLSNKEIGRDLNLAENTVKVHIAGIFKALGVMSRTQAMLVARERNIPLMSSTGIAQQGR